MTEEEKRLKEEREAKMRAERELYEREVKAEQDKPLSFEVDLKRYFACDMDMENLVFEPSKEHLSNAQKDAVSWLMKVAGSIYCHGQSYVNAEMFDIKEHEEVTLEKLLQLADSIAREKGIKSLQDTQREKEEKEATEKAKRAEIFEEAKRTGAPVVLSSYTTDCINSAKFDCSMDIVTVYAMPDGSTDSRRVHAC
ncbi:hypothetical protein [Alicyclobacillus fodiniaquatilis]|uniref:Uncharacterized protein n=1 Tax=Alicyclobacillus fodiniaquatilis TaxID=1661150 RepID=A0ABW4JMJ9_9BACL